MKVLLERLKFNNNLGKLSEKREILTLTVTDFAQLIPNPQKRQEEVLSRKTSVPFEVFSKSKQHVCHTTGMVLRQLYQ